MGDSAGVPEFQTNKLVLNKVQYNQNATIAQMLMVVACVYSVAAGRQSDSHPGEGVLCCLQGQVYESQN